MTPSGSATSAFDYIIVGGGTAGCVVANRLSANPQHRVLLLEAGGDDTNRWLHIPIGYARVFGKPEFNWIYQVQPEPQLNNRAGPFYQGKVIGGSSAVNGMIYLRGQREDFDHWVQLGCTGWDYGTVLKCYLRSEDQRSRAAGPYHSVGGPLAVSDPAEPHQVVDAFIAAAEQAGIPRNPDFNGATQEGAGYYQTMTRKGRRCSAAMAFIHPVKHRANLTVMTGARVERVLFEGKDASGVSVVVNGQRLTMTARREVILAAGAFASPLLLQASGVGPGGLLQSQGVSVVHDAPDVGQNLQNHFNPWISYRCKQPVTFNDQMASRWGRMQLVLQYALRRRGFMALGPVYGGALCRTALSPERPDIHIHFFLFGTERVKPALLPFSAVMATVCQLRPESRGSVELGGPDLVKDAKIRFNFMATELDRQTVAAGMAKVRELMHRPALQGYIGDELDAYPDVSTDEELKNYTGEVRGTAHHIAGTCRMGTDALAVLDPALRVRGVGKLRVVDNSIMPTLLSADTAAPAIMIGERGSDFILADAR
jgi:choline dehydrogenase